jgi:hypothetical protein
LSYQGIASAMPQRKLQANGFSLWDSGTAPAAEAVSYWRLFGMPEGMP